MEFDLKSFFCSVSLDKVFEKLLSKGIPKSVVDKLHYINCSGVKLKGYSQMNEFEARVKSMMMAKNTPEEILNLPRP